MLRQVKPRLPASLGATLLFAVLTVSSCDLLRDTTKPNVLLIVLDDLPAEILEHNPEHSSLTPALDAFAREGIHYAQHYTQATDAAARVALLTGNYPAFYGFRPDHQGLSPGTTTLASILQAAGYRTEHIGQWHVGAPTLHQSPRALGFERWFGFLFPAELGGSAEEGGQLAAPRYQNPWLRAGNTSAAQIEGHLTDIVTEKTVGFINSRRGRSEPWFLMLGFYGGHKPLQAAERYVSEFPETELGRRQAWMAHLDESLAAIFAALDNTAARDDTLVVLVSDRVSRGDKADITLGGQNAREVVAGLRSPLWMRWPEAIPAGVTSNELVSLLDILPTILAAADLRPPAQAIGRNLLGDDLADSPPQYWEAAATQQKAFSMLSHSGRWLFTRATDGQSGLYDLRQNVSVPHNVIDIQPEQASQLREDYRLWRRDQREVQLEYEPLNDRGGARLKGNNLQRAPGNGGYTFAIGVTPEAFEEDAQASAILQHGGRWGIYASAESTLVGVLGELLILPPLPLGQCSELVVTAYYSPDPGGSENKRALLEAFVDGRKLASRTVETSLPPQQGAGLPTYVGMVAPGKHLFNGTLGRPVILNERLALEGSSPLLGDSVLELPPLCE